MFISMGCHLNFVVYSKAIHTGHAEHLTYCGHSRQDMGFCYVAFDIDSLDGDLAKGILYSSLTYIDLLVLSTG